MYVMTETYIQEQKDAEVANSIKQTPPSESWKPLTEAELLSRLEESRAQYKKGQYKNIDDLDKESREW